MNAALLAQLERHVHAAYARGVDTPVELQGVVRDELAKRGYSLTSLPRIDVYVSLHGTRIVIGFRTSPVPLARGAVANIGLARLDRACRRCAGVGCGECLGRGWKPRHKL